MKDAVKRKFDEDLIGVSASNLTVYRAGTLEPVGDGIDPGDGVPAGTTSREPLIVVARAPQPQQNGECQSRLSYSCTLAYGFKYRPNRPAESVKCIRPKISTAKW
jgi:hypothetical protein